MDYFELWVSRSTQVKSKDGFELTAYGLLYALHTLKKYWHLPLTVWPQRITYRCFRKRVKLNYESQGQTKSDVKTNLNTDHIVSCLPL